MDTTSFIMIGNKETGKTTSMISAYGVLSKNGVSGFKIKALNESDKSELDSLFINLKRGEYPLATAKRSTYFFDLLYKDSPIHRFEWKDFNGGIINEKNIESVQVLKEDMQESSGIMLFFDAEKLYNNSIDTKVRRILHIISQNLVSIERVFYVAIVITKFDLLTDFQRHDIDTLLSPLKPLICNIQNSEYVYSLWIPTSCTANGMINVGIPILYMLHGSMSTYCDDKYAELVDEIQKYQNYVDNSGFFDDIVSFFSDEKTYRQLAQEKYNQVQPQIEYYNNVIEALKHLQKYIEDVDLLKDFFKTKKNKYNF